MDTTLTDGPALKVWEISMGHSQPLDCGKFSKFVKCILWSLLTTHLPEIFAEYSSRPRKYNNTGQSHAFLALKQWWMVLVMIGVIFFFNLLHPLGNNDSLHLMTQNSFSKPKFSLDQIPQKQFVFNFGWICTKIYWLSISAWDIMYNLHSC